MVLGVDRVNTMKTFQCCELEYVLSCVVLQSRRVCDSSVDSARVLTKQASLVAPSPDYTQ